MATYKVLNNRHSIKWVTIALIFAILSATALSIATKHFEFENKKLEYIRAIGLDKAETIEHIVKRGRE